MPIFLLIRHGENDFIKTGRLPGRLPNVHLNDNGRKQVQMVVKSLKDMPIKAVYSSPLERALETAEPIAGAFGLKVNTLEGLTETDCGEWSGQKISDLRRSKFWKVVKFSPSRLRFPGGESFLESQKRICWELEELVRKHEPRDMLVCVSHADPIRLAVAYFLGMPLDMFQRMYIAPASITTLDIGEVESRLLNLNYECVFSLYKS